MTRSSAPSSPWLERGLMAALLLACAVATSKCLADPDLWGHVQYGRDLLRCGLPSGAQYTYTAIGHRWINHEHLSELALAIGADTLGGASLLAIKTLLALAVFYRLICRAQKQELCRAAVYLGVLLTAANLMHFWSLRPQLLTLCSFYLLLELLDAEPQIQRAAERGLSPSRIWWSVPLMWIWANAHGGFLVGLTIALAFFVVRLAQAGWMSLRDELPTGRLGWLAARYSWVWFSMLAATALNPYGFRLHRWLLESLGQPRPEIVEWLPPELFSIAWAPFWITAAITVISLASSRRPRDLAQGVVIALALYEAANHRRHIALFALVFGIWVLPHVDDLLRRLGAGGDERTLDESVSPHSRSVVAAGLLGVLAVLGVVLFSQIRRIPVRVDSYPVAAVQFMADQNLHGKIVAQFKWAQYVLAAFAERPVELQMQLAFDGRFRTCYPQEMVDMYFDFALGDEPSVARHRSSASPAVNAARILEYRAPDLVLIDRRQGGPVQLLQQHSDQWTLLYQDAVAQLWGRAARFDDPQSPDYLPPPQRLLNDAPQQGATTWPALPRFSQGIQSTLAGDGNRPCNDSNQPSDVNTM